MKELAIEGVDDEEFWNILHIDQWIIFQSLNRIFVHNPASGELIQITSREEIVKAFRVNDQLYFQRKGVGLFRVVNGKDEAFLNNTPFRDDEIVGVFEDGKRLLILTRNKGFFQYRDGKTESIRSFIDTQPEMSVYSVMRLKNGYLALGTISDGILLLNDNLNKISWVNQGLGLQKNTVLSVYEDVDENLWVGLDYGISFLNIHSPVREFKDEQGVIGSVYSSIVYKGGLYLGTNQGLFHKPLKQTVDFELISGSQGQVWDLTIIDDVLFCGHHNGTYVVKNHTFQQVSSVPGTWDIKEIDNERVIQGNYNGLYILERNDDQWSLKNKLEGFNNSSRSFEVLDRSILVNHEYKGIYRVDVDNDFKRVVQVHYDSLFKGSNSSIARYNGRVYYAARDGIYVYDESRMTFERDSLLSSVYGEDEYISGNLVTSNDGASLWIFSKNNLIRITENNLSDIPKIEFLPLTYEIRKDVIEYENIIALDGLNRYLLGTSFGYLVFDFDQITFKDFTISIENVTVKVSNDENVLSTQLNPTINGNFGADENNLRINYFTPQYLKYFQPQYQYQLVGIYDSWSDWTTDYSVLYQNLPPGQYTFNVKARIGNKESENIASYSFVIAKPWYRSGWMIVLYVLGGLFLLIIINTSYRNYYHRQREKLLEAGRKERELLKLQNEQEIVRIKNQQLEEDFRNKSNELAASTMSIIKKNELLSHIKDQLATVKSIDDVKPIIKTVNKSLNQNQNWEIFKETFENIDTEFFKNLKKRHSNLSPNDLKVCAYLRLNLTSKEIAQLINISPKSVEVKRYRLRKKLNLQNDENLIDYILSI
jgi:DNA-binding CsgD family transcriptional regulator